MGFDLSDFIIDAYITIGGTSLSTGYFSPYLVFWLVRSDSAREKESHQKEEEKGEPSKREKKRKKKKRKRDVMYKNLSLSPTV